MEINAKIAALSGGSPHLGMALSSTAPIKAEIPALYKIEKMYIPADPAINYWYPTGDKAYWDAGGEVIKEVTNITTISTNTYFGSNPPENATCWKVHLYGDSVITSDLFVHNMTANAEPI